jgi:hypothetical protein
MLLSITFLTASGIERKLSNQNVIFFVVFYPNRYIVHPAKSQINCTFSVLNRNNVGPIHVPMDFRGSCGKIVSVADVEAEEHRQGGEFKSHLAKTTFYRTTKSQKHKLDTCILLCVYGLHNIYIILAIKL